MIITKKQQNDFGRSHSNMKLHRLLLAKGWTIARNSTFVYWRRSDDNNKYAMLTHADIHGNILFEKIFVQPSKDKDPLMLMSSEDQVIVTLHRQNRLLTVNLQTHEVSYLNHNFFKKPEIIRLYFFAETSLICVVQNKTKFELILKLTYYRLPLTEDSKPIASYQSKLINPLIQIFKGNNHSLIIWSHCSSNSIDIQTYDPRQSTENRHHQIITQRNIEGTLIVRNIWQSKKGVFCIVSEICQGVFQNLKLDVSMVMVQNMITRQAKFKSNLKYSKYQLVSCNNMGEICYFQLKQTAKKSHIFYIHNQTEKVVNVQIRESLKGYKYFGVSYDPNMLYEICLHRQTKQGYSKLTSVTRTVFLWPQVILHLLLHINQDFDDDLLKDAVQLIDYL